MKLARLLLRVTIGGIFIGHGTQKLFGWFGGNGPKATAEWFDSMGIKPGNVNAVAAGVAEAGGGAGLLLGFKTPFSASAVTAVMLTAINRVHLKNGPWISDGGYEYNAVLIAGAASLAAMGPGKLSLDGKKARSGLLYGLMPLVLGAAGAAGAHVLGATQAGGEGAEPGVAATEPSTATATEPSTATETEAPVAGEETVDGEIQPEDHIEGAPEGTE